MKLASFEVAGSNHFGIVTPSGLIDVSRRTEAKTLKDWIADGLPGAKAFATEDADYTLDEVTWLPPITDPVHIVGVGLNTKSHFEETAVLKNRIPGDYPKYPRLFLRSPLSVVAHEGSLRVPSQSDTLDYEAEIALVIGKPARNIDPANWKDYVLGFTCFNDGSVRGYQRHSDQVTAGKNFMSSGAVGPYVATLDEVQDPDSLELTLHVNGAKRQHLKLTDLIFSFGDLLSYISQPFELQPGDLIATGSPEGIGALTQQYLAAGDEVTIKLSANHGERPLMSLRNSVQSIG